MVAKKSKIRKVFVKKTPHENVCIAVTKTNIKYKKILKTQFYLYFWNSNKKDLNCINIFWILAFQWNMAETTKNSDWMTTPNLKKYKLFFPFISLTIFRTWIFYTDADMKIYRQLLIHINTLFTFWDMATQDIWNVCLKTHKKNKVC